jgi:cyclopropane fatty-acyl-phospholipid synthase-like methyltransferase
VPGTFGREERNDMTDVSTIPTWWQRSWRETGAQSMDKLLPRHCEWEDVLAVGRADLERGLRFTQLKPGREQTVVEIGCGVGRMCQALADHFGRVVGVDIAPALLEEARRQNRHPHVSFELLDGPRLQLKSVSQVDVVFSYEVLYLLPPELVYSYFRDAFQLLKPDGVFVFQLNLHPMTWKTHVARAVRHALHRVGVKFWHGWPTSPDFRRYPYRQADVCRNLKAAGFQVVRVAGDSLKQTWFVARPDLASRSE